MKMTFTERELETSIVSMDVLYNIFDMTDMHLDLDEIIEILKSNPTGICELSPGLTLSYDVDRREFTYEMDEELFQIQNHYARRLLKSVQGPLKAFAMFVMQFQSWSAIKKTIQEALEEMQDEIEQTFSRRLSE